MIITLHATNILPLTQEIEQSGNLSTKVNQTLAVSQVAYINLKHISVEQKFNPYQSVHNGLINIHVSQILVLRQKGNKLKELFGENKLLWTQAGVKFLEQKVNQQIVFSQTVTDSKQYSNTLSLSQTIGLNIIRNISIEQTFGVEQFPGIVNMNESCE